MLLKLAVAVLLAIPATASAAQLPELTPDDVHESALRVMHEDKVAHPQFNVASMNGCYQRARIKVVCRYDLVKREPLQEATRVCHRKVTFQRTTGFHTVKHRVKRLGCEDR